MIGPALIFLDRDLATGGVATANRWGRVAGVGAYSRNPGIYRVSGPGLQEYLPAPATRLQ